MNVMWYVGKFDEEGGDILIDYQVPGRDSFPCKTSKTELS
jgi:hypothetical protein